MFCMMLAHLTWSIALHALAFSQTPMNNLQIWQIIKEVDSISLIEFVIYAIKDLIFPEQKNTHAMLGEITIKTLLRVVLFLVMKRMNLIEKILSMSVCTCSNVIWVLTTIRSIKNVWRDLLQLSNLSQKNVKMVYLKKKF